MINKYIKQVKGIIHPLILRGLRIKRYNLAMFTILLSIFLLPTISKADANQLNSSQTDSQACHLLIIGASYAANWKINQIAGCHVINKGVAGDRTHQMLARFSQDVAAHKPEYVLVWGFINDISNSDSDKYQAAKENVKSNLIELLNNINSISSQPILATEITLGFPPGIVNNIVRWKNKLLGKTTYQKLINEHVMDLNHWLIDYAAKNRILLLQFQRALSDEGGYRIPAYLEDDGSHVSSEGYLALDSYLESKEVVVQFENLR